jgi:high-affinity nickel-transport protein
LGFLLGVRHATDADHVIAVTTIVSRQRHIWASSLIGALWGIGHTLTILLVGGAIVVFRWVIPATLGIGMELAVAVMLVALGFASLSPLGPRVPGRITARPLLVGVVHGLAGSAAVALLVLSTIRTAGWALGYLVVFCVGTVGGMMLLTTALSLPFAFTVQRFERVNAWLGRATGFASIGLGGFVGYQLIAVLARH